MKKVTLKDIAVETGLSVVTVSKVINAKDETAASKDKIELIRQTASTLGYSPREAGTSVGKSRPLKVGVFTVADHQKSYKHPFYQGLYKVIKDCAMKENMQISYFHDFTEIGYDRIVREKVLSGDVKKIIILGDDYLTDNPGVKSFKSYFNQIVSISPYFFSDKLILSNDVIVIDTYYSTKDVLNRLLNNGKKNILLFSGPKAKNISKLSESYYRKQADGREIAYFEAFKEKGLQVNEDLVYNCEWDAGIASEILESIIAQKKIEFDAIFAGDDMIAIACMKILNRKNIKIPDEVSVVGFNNQEFSKYTSPSLSTIDIYYDEIGSMAIELLKYKNENVSKVPVKIMVPSNFIKRGSCGL